eukprot:COSAG01_NODE_1283_length_10920_cov_5.539507_10_plen_67_part_00
MRFVFSEEMNHEATILVDYETMYILLLYTIEDVVYTIGTHHWVYGSSWQAPLVLVVLVPHSAAAQL